ncbi:MAG: hypothetical protein COZ06_11495 [Armatimonadetes bacterium CG_4_10_14_3_um_filter_66_18]|nr:SGNH/GDSL hydrolase family protein [Armatimonadota bacterium]OIP05856.1 MAG: hypothetical protein AUJ96_10050 [Armatimonadetes bacterium CG2_30_66_41]PIX45063.1 MAG: hypothetical protein COZ57_16420 [Armatimonadetes bacterium CG_4_8_14_3_um_filter_66_20]PIY50023.1 MAG: hypothetical protein COZ06_11495 [Armatimonadetes bacterium CG_4_10_14_3_um_filter_66_18]PIZ51161.1 MAG: hypothetical protein COY42_00615 [Armatimonadetes bacterium CG_4_10_14_0_8_um_filter_66_14]PJB68213.1 MAG: hypothetical 
MSEALTVEVGSGTRRPDLDERALFLTVADTQGSYTIPYIQSSRVLTVRGRFASGQVDRAVLSLRREGVPVAEKTLSRAAATAEFGGLEPGEYSLTVRETSNEGGSLSTTEFTRLGVGTVLAALGDSITEGYHGEGFWRDDLHLTGRDFPPAVVSKDGRNFPQFAPTTHVHKPTVNCFQSWMTRLNDLLSESWRHPVFLANEGWGGITAGGYLSWMDSDEWQKRMRLLHPQLWLIHLGVNDERARLPGSTVANNLSTMVDRLVKDFGASPARVLLAKPCYDYAPGAATILKAYCTDLDYLIARRGLSHGPDFFEAYSTDKERWYGVDPVHPNVVGMERMAELWHRAVVAAFPRGAAA